MGEQATARSRSDPDEAADTDKIVIGPSELALDDGAIPVRTVGDRSGNGNASLCVNINTEEAHAEGITKGDQLIINWVDGILVGVPLERALTE